MTILGMFDSLLGYFHFFLMAQPFIPSTVEGDLHIQLHEGHF